MKSFPIDGYRFFQHGNRVIAVSTYAGRTVRGIAVCAEGDDFDLEYGKRLAAARCNFKIAQKRRDRALGKVVQAVAEVEAANLHMDNARSYFYDAGNAVLEAGNEVDLILAEKAEI